MLGAQEMAALGTAVLNAKNSDSISGFATTPHAQKGQTQACQHQDGGRNGRSGQRTRRQTDAAQIRQWLTVHLEDRTGAKGATRKSNRTDNDSAKIAPQKLRATRIP